MSNVLTFGGAKIKAFFEEKKLRKDALVWAIFFILPWIVMGIANGLSENVLGAGGDAVRAGYPLRLYAAENSLWTPYVANGVFKMMYGGAQSAYPLNLLIMNLMPNPVGFNVYILLHFSLAGIFTYMFLRSLKMKYLSAFFGGAVFMFCGFMASHPLHVNLLCAAVYLPLVLYFVEQYAQTRKFGFLFGGAIAFALSILADYWAVPFYIGVVTLPYLLYRSIEEGKKRQEKWTKTLLECLKVCVAVFIGGLLLSAFFCAVVFQSFGGVINDETTYEYFSTFNIPAYMSPIFLFPFLFSRDISLAGYFGPWDVVTTAAYIFIFPLVLGISAFLFLRKKNTQIWFWTIMALFTFLLILGNDTPLNKLAYHVPMYNQFRAPSRNLLELSFAVAVLSSMGLNRLLQKDEDGVKRFARQNRNATVILVAAAVITILLVLNFALGESLRETATQYWKITSPTIYVPLLLMVAAATVFAAIGKWGFNAILKVVFFAVLFLDVMLYAPVMAGYESPPPTETHAVKAMSETDPDKDQYRIFATYPMDGLFPTANIANNFQAINIYTGTPRTDYNTLTEFGEVGIPPYMRQFLKKNELLSVLGTKYIVMNAPQTINFLDTLPKESINDTVLIDQGTAYDFISNAQVAGDEYILTPGSSGQFALMQVGVPIQPDTLYRLEFELQGTRGVSVNIDLFGEGYDGPEQDLAYQGSMVSDEYKSYTAYIVSDNAPDEVVLRVAAYGDGEVHIKNIRLTQPGEVMVPVYEKRFEDEDGTALYKNPNVLERARFVEELLPVTGTDHVNEYFLVGGSFDPKTQALVEGVDEQIQMDSGSVTSADYSDNDHPVFQVETYGDRAFFVLSDSYYPGWEAYVDGQPQEIYKTYGYLRGVFVEGEGNHTIEFYFRPKALYYGAGVTIATGGIFVLLWVWDVRKRKKANQLTDIASGCTK